MAARGRFNALIGFVPRRKAIRAQKLHRAPMDTVFELMVAAHSLQLLSSGMDRSYPKLPHAVRIS